MVELAGGVNRRLYPLIKENCNTFTYNVYYGTVYTLYDWIITSIVALDLYSSSEKKTKEANRHGK